MHRLNITELFTYKWLRWFCVFYDNKNAEGVLWLENHHVLPPVIVKTKSDCDAELDLGAECPLTDHSVTAERIKQHKVGNT